MIYDDIWSTMDYGRSPNSSKMLQVLLTIGDVFDFLAQNPGWPSMIPICWSTSTKTWMKFQIEIQKNKNNFFSPQHDAFSHWCSNFCHVFFCFSEKSQQTFRSGEISGGWCVWTAGDGMEGLENDGVDHLGAPTAGVHVPWMPWMPWLLVIFRYGTWTI